MFHSYLDRHWLAFHSDMPKVPALKTLNYEPVSKRTRLRLGLGSRVKKCHPTQHPAEWYFPSKTKQDVTVEESDVKSKDPENESWWSFLRLRKAKKEEKSKETKTSHQKQKGTKKHSKSKRAKKSSKSKGSKKTTKTKEKRQPKRSKKSGSRKKKANTPKPIIIPKESRLKYHTVQKIKYRPRKSERKPTKISDDRSKGSKNIGKRRTSKTTENKRKSTKTGQKHKSGKIRNRFLYKKTARLNNRKSKKLITKLKSTKTKNGLRLKRTKRNSNSNENVIWSCG